MAGKKELNYLLYRPDCSGAERGVFRSLFSRRRRRRPDQSWRHQSCCWQRRTMRLFYLAAAAAAGEANAAPAQPARPAQPRRKDGWRWLLDLARGSSIKPTRAPATCCRCARAQPSRAAGRTVLAGRCAPLSPTDVKRDLSLSRAQLTGNTLLSLLTGPAQIRL